jgi:PPOX class probable F420-dependent enzyme
MMEPDQARAMFTSASVLRLATADAEGRPHLVPCTFAMDDSGRIVIGIDNKPKTTMNLRRLRNIQENPQVSLLVDEYAEDWTRLWWVRADGTAIIEHDGPEHEAHWRQLATKYRQYGGQVLNGPVIAVTPSTWLGWAYSPQRGLADGQAPRTGNS